MFVTQPSSLAICSAVRSRGVHFLQGHPGPSKCFNVSKGVTDMFTSVVGKSRLLHKYVDSVAKTMHMEGCESLQLHSRRWKLSVLGQ